jgi:hypothetical protein
MGPQIQGTGGGGVPKRPVQWAAQGHIGLPQDTTQKAVRRTPQPTCLHHDRLNTPCASARMLPRLCGRRASAPTSHQGFVGVPPQSHTYPACRQAIRGQWLHAHCQPLGKQIPTLCLPQPLPSAQIKACDPHRSQRTSVRQGKRRDRGPRMHHERATTYGRTSAPRPSPHETPKPASGQQMRSGATRPRPRQGRRQAPWTSAQTRRRCPQAHAYTLGAGHYLDTLTLQGVHQCLQRRPRLQPSVRSCAPRCGPQCAHRDP